MELDKGWYVFGAFVAAWTVSAYLGHRVARGDSTEPEHVQLQTRQDVGGVFACLTMTNGLLAAILATLLVR